MILARYKQRRKEGCKQLFALCLAMLPVAVFAQKLTPQDALERMTNGFHAQAENHRCKIQSRHNTDDWQLAWETPHVYVFQTDEGFALTPTTASGPTCLGYSDGGTFENAMRHENFRHFVQTFEQKMQDEFRIFRPAGVPDAVPPLCQDLWDQFQPFNRHCPVIDGDTCVVGCVATAMTQVMRYHQWPQKGEGSFSYNDSTGCKQVLTADFSTHTYDWANMLDRYDMGYNERQAEAVALLSSDCGIAVRMRYGKHASGANCIYQPIAMTKYFGYDEGIQMYYRNFFPQAEWDSIMFTELSEQRPMLVGGWSTDLAHAFICDGYDEQGFFHVRLGNPGGDGDGFYYFNWLTPDQPQWHDVNNPEGGLNLLQSITTGIKPRGDEPSRQRFIYGFSHISIADSTEGEIVVHHLSNLGWNEHPYRVGIAIKAIDEAQQTAPESTQLLYTYDRHFQLEEVEDTSYTDTIRLRIPTTMADGTYRICPVYEENGLFYEARTMVGIPNYLRCQLKHGQAALTQATEAQARLSVRDVSIADTLMKWSRPHLSFTVHNDGAEYSGRIYLSLYRPELPQFNYIICSEGLHIKPGETFRRDFVRTAIPTLPLGTYYARIMCDVDLFTDSIVTLYEDEERPLTIINYVSGIEDIATDEALTKQDEYFDLSGRKISRDEMNTKGGVYLRKRKGVTEKIWNRATSK